MIWPTNLYHQLILSSLRRKSRVVVILIEAMAKWSFHYLSIGKWKISRPDVAHDGENLTSGGSTDSWLENEYSAASRFSLSKQDYWFETFVLSLVRFGWARSTSVAGAWVALSLSASMEGTPVFRYLHHTFNFSRQLRTNILRLEKIDVMNFLPSITLEKFVFGLQATSLLWSRWLPSDANVREDYDARAEETSTSIRAASVANANPILGAELAVIARNKAVADERRRTSPLGLIFALLKKPRTKPIGYFRDKYALKFFKKAYTECSHEEQLKVSLQHKDPVRIRIR